MEFNRIEITNFLSYYDTVEIEFSPLTTIFIGQNNTGKSKLFDAINFVLYGRVFPTDKGLNGDWIDEIREISSFVLNTHKKKLALENKEDSITVSVELTMTENNRHVIAKRNINYKLIENDYQYASNTFSLIGYDKLDGSVLFSETGEGAVQRLNRYFSPKIKDYFLFQGEAASKIMQLQKGGNFSRAVKEIARLSVFELAKEIASEYNKKVNSRINKQLKKNKEQQEERIALQIKLKSKEDEIAAYERIKNEASDSLSSYNAKLEELELELSSLKEFEEYFKQKKVFEENLKKTNRDLKYVDDEKIDITVESIFYKVRDKIKRIGEFYSQLEKKGEVPPSIPAVEIKKALLHHRCTICNTDLSLGTEARRFAESRLPKCDTDKLGNYLRELNTTIGDYYDTIESIPASLGNIIKKKQQLEERKADLQKQKEELQDLLADIELDESASKEKQLHIDEVRQSIRRYTDLQDKAKRELYIAEDRIEKAEKERRETNAKINSLIIDDDELDFRDKALVHYADKLSTTLNNLHKLAHDTAYNTVQSKADEYYKGMTKENAALVGSIRIDTETSEIYTVDEQGNRIRNINQGNRISIQLAVIAGILTVAQDQFGQQYPFVTDASVSSLGGDNKQSTIKTILEAFEQSVIIIKDDTSSKNKTNDEIRKLIFDSSDVGIAYELSLSKADNIQDQYTVVTRIKG